TPFQTSRLFQYQRHHPGRDPALGPDVEPGHFRQSQPFTARQKMEESRAEREEVHSIADVLDEQDGSGRTESAFQLAEEGFSRRHPGRDPGRGPTVEPGHYRQSRPLTARQTMRESRAEREEAHSSADLLDGQDGSGTTESAFQLAEEGFSRRHVPNLMRAEDH